MRTQSTILLAALLLAACGMLQEPPSVPDSIAAGYVTVETIAEGAADSPLSEARKASIRDGLERVLDILDSATDVYEAGDEAAARDRLNQARAILTELEEVLREHA